MSSKPFTLAFAHDFLPLLVNLLKTEPIRFFIVTYSTPVVLTARYETLPQNGWLQVMDRSSEPDKPIPLGEEKTKPQVVFLELTSINAEVVATEVRRCQAVGIVAVVVTTAIKTPAGAALDELEAWHDRYQLCDLHVYLLQARGDLRPLYNELLRAASTSTKR